MSIRKRERPVVACRATFLKGNREQRTENREQVKGKKFGAASRQIDRSEKTIAICPISDMKSREKQVLIIWKITEKRKKTDHRLVGVSGAMRELVQRVAHRL